MNLKHSLTRFGSAAFLAAMAPATVLAQSNPFQRANAELNTVQNQALGTAGAPQNIYTIAGNIINVVLGFLGIVLLGYMIYAGFLWMTSGGEQERAKEARTMIANSIIGLIIIVAAFAISNFVLGSLVNITGSR
ncbi:hypothetical protein KBD61_02655 [Patescibacteria group bacterium]|nr:hypothetical protein [Patescibacteria group bacterium]MBP9709905.1 hypothetical protein [Patescibacteria group bacterium]